MASGTSFTNAFMEKHPIINLKRFIMPAFAGGLLGFIIFLELTYPIAQRADLPLPPTLCFGGGPIAELQSQLLSWRTDLYWLTIFFNNGFGFVGLLALAFVGFASLMENIESQVSKARGTVYYLPKIPSRYFTAISIALLIALIADLAWMNLSIGTVYLHFSCIELVCSQICLGILVVFVHDELKKVSIKGTLSAKRNDHVAFRVVLAFSAVCYFLFSEMFAWPCAWFLNYFPKWEHLSPSSCLSVALVATIYTSITLYAAYAFVVINHAGALTRHFGRIEKRKLTSAGLYRSS